MPEPVSADVAARMRDDWNVRAREDAHYYVAFGRREQDEEEFLATAHEVVTSVEWEMKRLPPGNPRARRALEIGCGPGRLVKPLARHFGEIHGVDISDEMVRMGRERLRGIPHAHLHAVEDSRLAQFADSSFDVVYSYAVFQHIPSREVIMEYLRAIQRVLKPGGLARLHFNGLPKTARVYDTWAGVRIGAEEMIQFSRDYDFQILALEGTGTQYMWTTWLKHDAGWRNRLKAGPRQNHMHIRRITNAFSSDPVATNLGRFASVSIWVEQLPPELDLFDLETRLGGAPARGTYIGPPDRAGLQQLNVVLDEKHRTGLLPVEMLWFGEPLCPPEVLRVIPPGPQIPQIVSVTDGIDLLSGTTIRSGAVKVTIEEVSRIEEFAVRLDDSEINGLDRFCTDPLTPRWEVNFCLPEGVAPGSHSLELRLDRRRFPPVEITVSP